MSTSNTGKKKTNHDSRYIMEIKKFQGRLDSLLFSEVNHSFIYVVFNVKVQTLLR